MVRFCFFLFFFFKQKTAYTMRISVWSSDVCSSDLKDQSLTLGEYEQLWLDAMRERMVDRFQDLDADGDAKVTAEEFQRPFAKVVRHMDRNEDGVVDRSEARRVGKAWVRSCRSRWWPIH